MTLLPWPQARGEAEDAVGSEGPLRFQSPEVPPSPVRPAPEQRGHYFPNRKTAIYTRRVYTHKPQASPVRNLNTRTGRRPEGTRACGESQLTRGHPAGLTAASPARLAGLGCQGSEARPSTTSPGHVS